MGEIWQEHRRFILTIVLGGLVFLVALLVVDGIYGGEIQRSQRTIDRARRDQLQALPKGVSAQEVARDRSGLEGEVKGLREDLDRKAAEGYAIGEKERDPDLHYNAQIDRLRRGPAEECALRNIWVDPNLGQPSTFPTTKILQDWYLKGYDVVAQVLQLALEADRSLEGGIARIERITIEKPADPARGGAAARDPFVLPLKVGVTVVGHPRAIDTLLRPLALDPRKGGEGRTPGRYVALEAATIRSLDAPPGDLSVKRQQEDPLDKDRVEATLHLAALRINMEGRLDRVPGGAKKP